jgi:1-aminocyclopropane-1-carboxylate deaminase/D-cysteine desulfhydrase-like pyridoxal-dependent ACC family enzyme
LLQLGRFPRVRQGHIPTPLEPMTRLSAHLGGPTLWIKRDCTGFASGGNKTRKLEFLVADALAQGADTLITLGALGYVGCALEILQQAAGLGVRIDRAVHATGSGGTQAGLIPASTACEAVSLLAETEGVLLDPVYSGKAMSGLIDLVRKGAFGKDKNIVFVHTGGHAALFAYEPAFAA